MASNTSEVGLIPPTLSSAFVGGNSYGVSIDTVKGVSVPTGLVRPEFGGVLECYIVVEGTVTARYRWDGTNPTTAVGLLLPAPTATVPIALVLVGESLINAFKIIGTAGGDTISYTFAFRDTR